MKVLVGAFNLEEALAGAFSMIVKTDCETNGAIHSTTLIAVLVWRTGKMRELRVALKRGGEGGDQSSSCDLLEVEQRDAVSDSEI